MTDREQNSVERVGILGVGSMGRGIAANLARKGFKVWAYDPRPAAVEAVAAEGITAASSPAEVARAAQVTLAIPYDYAQVEQAVFGPGGVAEGLAAPGLFVCMSTIGPDNARDLAARLAERGHRLVDAPVSGGATGAAEGTLTLMVGAPDEDLARCRPVLDAFAGNIFHVGQQAGAGQAAKLANQLLVVTHHVAAVEALALGARSGVDPQQLYEIIKTAVGNSRVFELRVPVILDRSFKTGGSLNILVKDSRLVVEAARSAHVPLFAASAAAQVFEAARDYGLGDEDDAAVAKIYELLSGGEPIS